MDHPARLPVDCPRCENRGVLALDEDRTIACPLCKATLKSYSSIAPPMVGRYAPGQAYLAAQGRVFVVRYGYGDAANWQELEDAARQAIGTIDTRPMARSSLPVLQSLLRRSYVDDATFTIIIRADKA